MINADAAIASSLLHGVSWAFVLAALGFAASAAYELV